MDFSHHESPNPARVACDWGEISETIRLEIHLTWKTIQNAYLSNHFYKNTFSRILLHFKAHYSYAKIHCTKVEDLENPHEHDEMDLSHKCSLHGGKSEICEKNDQYISTFHDIS